MDLKKALSRALKFVPKAKDSPEILQCVRLIPRFNGAPARVMSTDGNVTFLADIPGTDLPNALIPAVAMGQAAKQAITQIVEAESGRVKVISDNGAEMGIAGRDVAQYPGIPGIPEMRLVADWADVEKVVHAAAGPKEERGAVRCVHFTPEYVEACDRDRLARVDVITGFSGLVPAEAFKAWPKGAVVAAFSTTHAFFRVGYETRIASLQPGPYPETEALVSPAHAGPFWITNAEVLAAMVKQASGFSVRKQISIEFGFLGIDIGACSDGAGEAFGGRVDATPGSTLGVVSGGGILLSGPLLSDALGAMETPKVRLCYRGPLEPLRLESGALVECLWPLNP